MNAFFERLDSQQVAARSIDMRGPRPRPEPQMPVAGTIRLQSRHRGCHCRSGLCVQAATGLLRSAGLSGHRCAGEDRRVHTVAGTGHYDHRVTPSEGDIGEVASAYATALCSRPGASTPLTVNPYLGVDTIEPFQKTPGKGDFRGVPHFQSKLRPVSEPDCIQRQGGDDALRSGGQRRRIPGTSPATWASL